MTTPSSPELLTFLLGSFLEQKELILKKRWSSRDLEYIWKNLNKNPDFKDNSNISVFELHLALLKQPQLPQEIISQLYLLYKDLGSANLKPELFAHSNIDLSIFQEELTKAINTDNFTTLSWLLNNKNNQLHIIIDEVFNENIFNKLINISSSKQGSQEAIQVQKCLGAFIKITNQSKLINHLFKHLKDNKLLSASWCHYFIKNINTSSQIIFHIVNNFRNNLGDYQFIELLNHPSTNEKTIFLLLDYFKTQPKDSRSFNEFIFLVKNNQNLSGEALNKIYLMYPTHSELIIPILNHTNFSPDYIWTSFLNTKLFDSLPSYLQKIITDKLT